MSGVLRQGYLSVWCLEARISECLVFSGRDASAVIFLHTQESFWYNERYSVNMFSGRDASAVIFLHMQESFWYNERYSVNILPPILLIFFCHQHFISNDK